MKKLVLLLTTVVFVGSILFSCGGGSDKDKEIRIGSIIPLTGMFSAGGVAIEFGIKAAIDDINKAKRGISETNRAIR